MKKCRVRKTALKKNIKGLPFLGVSVIVNYPIDYPIFITKVKFLRALDYSFILKIMSIELKLPISYLIFKGY